MNSTPRKRLATVVGRLSMLVVAASIGLFTPGGLAQDDSAGEGLRPQDPPVADEPGHSLLILNDGRRFRGKIKRKDRFELVLEIATIDTRFKVADILEIIPLKSFNEYYGELKATIRADDYEQRYRFCEWIYHRGHLELAARELEELLDNNGRLDEARELLRVVNAAIELEDAQAEANLAGPAGAAAENAQAKGQGRLSPTMLLSDEQVNLIKVYETDLNHPPPLLIRRSTIERLLSEYALDQTLPTSPEGKKAYYRRDPVDILSDLFRLQARDLYPEVQVRGEPLSLNKFRLNLHKTWLMNSCATNQCHGGLEAGKFFLFNKQAHTSNTVYTNLLILERTRLRGEPLLNYDRPERSPLLQLGLPQDRSVYPHPNVDGWRPAFRDQADPQFTRAVDWMRSMYTPRPEYPIDYQPPQVTFNLGHAAAGEANPPANPPADAVEPGEGGDEPSR